MTTPIPAPSPPAFRLDATLRAVSTLLAVLGVILAVAGLTLPLFLPVASIWEGVRRAFVPALSRVLLGLSLLIGAMWVRRGRRHGAALLTLALILVAINALVVRGWRGAIIAMIAGVLIVPLIARWRTFA